MYINILFVSSADNQFIKMKNLEKNKIECPFRFTMNILEGKWKFAIIYSLMKHDKLRFKELERDVTGITSRMLIKELKDLEKNKIVKRKAYATVPPTVEYSLTPKGRSLDAIINAISEWGTQNSSIQERQIISELAV